VKENQWENYGQYQSLLTHRFRLTQYHEFLLPDPKPHLTLILILILYCNPYHPYFYCKFKAGLNFTLTKFALLKL